MNENRYIPYPVSGDDPTWSSPDTWREAAFVFSFLIKKHRSGLGSARKFAVGVDEQLATLSPVMEALCRETCPSCSDSCCSHATIWYDFRDLLYLALMDRDLPPSQIYRDKSGLCHCLGPEGCRLKREFRPFICTWYICPAQRILLTGEEAARVDRMILGIKEMRRGMEEAFIRVTTGRR